MKKYPYSTVILQVLCLWCIGCGSPDLYDPPKTVEESLQSFDLIDGFTIEALATEPEVLDPVDLVFDEYGRIYVVEMPDYPFKPAPGEGKGRIKQLFDEDQDGSVDRAVTFAEGISEATSILPWRAGLLVAAAPHISYWKDLDGDGRADTTEVLFTGFFENNSEAQITNLQFGIDNWIYASNHGQGGTITYRRDTTRPPLQIAGGDFRFRLDTEAFEVEAGPAQFGQAFNDRWHRFVTQNSLHIRHVVMPWRYLKRHAHLPTSTVAHNVSDHEAEMFQATPPPYWRAERTRRRQASYDEQGLDRKEYAEDYFTGCSGGTFYGGHTFPDHFYGNIFTGEVAGNLVHRDVIEPLTGTPTYTASRPEGELQREFLISTDSWFRPAHFSVGPDGYLYIVDYYRQHIETPLSIPTDLKEDMDFLRGSDMGRIYRIKPQGAETVAPGANIADLEGKQLVDLLEHPNRWHRLTAQRLILERGDKTIVPVLRQLFFDADRAVSRLHALYALDGLQAIDAEDVQRAMQDHDPSIREHGLMLAEDFPELYNAVAEAISDQDDRVSFQALLSVGQFDRDGQAQLFAEALKSRAFNHWYNLAVLSSEQGSTLKMAEVLLRDVQLMNTISPNLSGFVRDLAYAIGHRNEGEDVATLLKYLMNSQWSESSLDRIVSGLQEGILKSGRPVHLDAATQVMLEEAAQAHPAWEGLTIVLDTLAM